MSFASARRAEPPPSAAPNNSMFCRSEPRVSSGAESLKNKENPTLTPMPWREHLHAEADQRNENPEILNQITWQSTWGKTSKSCKQVGRWKWKTLATMHTIPVVWGDNQILQVLRRKSWFNARCEMGIQQNFTPGWQSLLFFRFLLQNNFHWAPSWWRTISSSPYLNCAGN